MTEATGDVRVRPLEARDRAAWEPLWSGYLAFYGAWLPSEVFDAQFERLGAGGDFLGLVAADEATGELLGIAHCVFHGHGWRLERVCYLQDLFTAPEARGRGAGEALIRAVYATADARGTPYVYWLTEETNATARSLYDRVGRYTPFVRYVRPS